MLRWRLGAVPVLALAVVLGGCSSAKPASSDQDPKAPLEIWIRQAPDSESAKTAQRLAAAFTKESGVKTKVVALFDDFETKLQQQAARKDLPDIVINDTAQLGTMRTQGWIREVEQSDIAGGDKLSERAWNAARASNGKYYAVPFSAQAFAMFVRADWRQKLKLPEPKTWDDLVTMATAFTKHDPDGNGKNDTYGFAIPGTTKRGYMSWYWSTYLWANGGDYLQGNGGTWRPVINDAKSVEAATWLRDLYCKRKVVSPDSVTLDTPRTHEVFEKGQAGMYLTGPYLLGRFVQTMGSDKLEVFPIPNGPSGGPGALAEGENVYLMNGSANEAGQKKFAEYAASPPGQKIGMNGDAEGAIVRLPVNTGVDMASVRKDQRWNVFSEVYDTAGVYTPSVPNWTPFRQMSAETLNAVAANCDTDVKQALDKLAGQFSDELDRQGVLAS